MAYDLLDTTSVWWSAVTGTRDLAGSLLQRMPADAVADAVRQHGAQALGGICRVVAAADTDEVVDALVAHPDTGPIGTATVDWLLDHADEALKLLGKVAVTAPAVPAALDQLARRSRWDAAATLASAPWCSWPVLLGWCERLDDGQVAALLDVDVDAPVLAALARVRHDDRDVAAAVLGARDRPGRTTGADRLSPLVAAELVAHQPQLRDDADLAGALAHVEQEAALTWQVAHAEHDSALAAALHGTADGQDLRPVGSAPDPADPADVTAWLFAVGGYLPPDRMGWVAEVAAGTWAQVSAGTWEQTTRQVGSVRLGVADELLAAGAQLPPGCALQAARPEWALGSAGAVELLADAAAAEVALSSIGALASRMGSAGVDVLASSLVPARAVALVADEQALGAWLARHGSQAGTILALLDGWSGTLEQLAATCQALQPV